MDLHVVKICAMHLVFIVSNQRVKFNIVSLLIFYFTMDIIPNRGSKEQIDVAENWKPIPSAQDAQFCNNFIEEVKRNVRYT